MQKEKEDGLRALAKLADCVQYAQFVMQMHDKQMLDDTEFFMALELFGKKKSKKEKK